MISLTLFMCFVGVILSAIVLVCGFVRLNNKDKETDRYIARLESENRRLKYTVSLMERKANGDRVVYTASTYNK